MSEQGEYVLYFPFELPQECSISDTLPYRGILSGYSASIISNAPYYAIIVERIETAEAASVIFRRLSVALHLVAIELNVAVRLKNCLQDVTYSNDPALAARNMKEQGFPVGERLDALIDGARPAIYRQGQVVHRLTGQPASFRLGFSPKNIIAICEKSLALSLSTNKIDSRVKLAIDVYCYGKFETSGPARFVLLCTVLEVLAPSAQKLILSGKTQMALNDFKTSLQEEMRTEEPSSTESRLLQSLISRLGSLERDSHIGRIKNYIERSLKSANREDFSETTRTFSELYNRRGDLVHDGSLILNDELVRVDELVRFLLALELSKRSPDEQDDVRIND